MNTFVASTIFICSILGTSVPFLTAWSFAPKHQYPTNGASHYYQRFHPLLSTSTSQESTPYDDLSSAYDRQLPPSIVGEAVRAALRSDRGICFDFTTNRYSDNGCDGRLVSVIKIRGKGTRSFLNAKFSQSVPRKSTERDGRNNNGSLELIRTGVAFETGYLTSKGRIIDRIFALTFLNDRGEDVSDEAILITSPGNSGGNLYYELSPLVFPMDQVTLTDCTSSSSSSGVETSVLTLACSKLNDAKTSFDNNVAELLGGRNGFDFPSKGVCSHYKSKGSDIYLFEHTFLSTDACHGYSMVFEGDGLLSNQVWAYMTAEQNDQGPVGVGSLEYETLRIEAGIPGYGYEMTGDGPKRKKSDDEDSKELESEDEYFSKANPLELHLQHLVDTEKGCYQGQEGVASMMKNPRGSPRMLYQVVFYDSENDFDDDGGGGSFLMSIDNDKLREFQQLKKQSTVVNDTRQPKPGDSLYVLGSNESIFVGTITSVAEPNGTGDAKTVALALIRRADSILKSIKDQDLEMPKWWDTPDNDDDDTSSGPYGAKLSSDKGTSGIMNPPPLDPLVNLEVTIKGTYTIGRLQSLPSRRYQNAGGVATILDYEGRGEVVATSPDNNAFTEPEITVINDGTDESQRRVIDVTIGQDDPIIKEIAGDDESILNDIAEAEREAAEAAAQAKKAAAEAKRKAEKMEMLKAKAEAAMAARRKKKEEAS
ncbi:hypothetical protein ACHAWO_002399 [Cyclotella atomus]|uniref:Uncharacterized protein n=1 Tax=Cyclotella atomus TaxID=382360 RepID=A0ABD3QGH8_9STRA